MITTGGEVIDTATTTMACCHIQVEGNEKFQLEVRENKDVIFSRSNSWIPRNSICSLAVSITFPNVNVYLLNWKGAHNILVVGRKEVIKQHVQ